jgi:flagellar basal-body rod protein FlgG
MTRTIAMIEGAMRADAEALRVIGQNIASAEVTAYRRQIPLAASGFAQLLDETPESTGPSATPARRSVATDMRPGTLRSTGEPLNLALEGSGFFALQSQSGTLLTRRGDFHVSAQGILTTSSGEAVLGNNGRIQVGTEIPTIDTDGTVRVGADVIDQLNIVQVADPASLQDLGNGLYLSTQDTAAPSDGFASVRQGFLETSNVAPVGEMVQMMETLRHFEASQRFVTGYDDMLEKAISELGKVD